MPAEAAASAAPGGTRRVLLLYAGTIAFCLAVYAAFAVPGAWFPGAVAKTYEARGLTLARGAGGLDGAVLVITGVDESGAALVSLNTDFRSTDYPVVAWTGSGFSEQAEVHLLWRSDYAPGKVNSIRLDIASGSLQPATLAGQRDWIGRIAGLALSIRGPLTKPLRIDGVVAQPGGIAPLLGDRAREWLRFAPWSGSSINTVSGGADVQRLPLTLLLLAAAALAVAVWSAWAWRRDRARALPAVLATLFLAAWVLLDARWSLSLARQTSETRAQFGGKDWRDAHRAAEDGPLFEFIEKAKSKLPAQPARVFVIADDDYQRGRTAYHLYPHNVLWDPFANTLPSAQSLKSGDFVVVFQRRGVQYNAAAQRLRWEGAEPIPAESLLTDRGAALFRIL